MREQPFDVACRAKVPLTKRLTIVRVVSCGTSITAGNAPILSLPQQLATSGWT
jgi:hypothetical protein